MSVTRRELGVSQELLSQAIDVNPRTIRRWHTGDARPRLYLHQVHALMVETGKSLPELIDLLDPYWNN